LPQARLLYAEKDRFDGIGEVDEEMLVFVVLDEQRARVSVDPLRRNRAWHP
jgi:hypothetical protein